MSVLLFNLKGVVGAPCCFLGFVFLFFLRPRKNSIDSSSVLLSDVEGGTSMREEYCCWGACMVVDGPSVRGQYGC